VAPAEDELYYWAWSQSLKGSYFDHPPLVAYLIRISTTIFGNNLFGIRFFSCLSSFYILWVIRSYCRGGQVLSYVLFTPIFALGSILMTPDTPLLFFWTAYLVWVTHTVLRINSWNEDPVDRVYHSSPVSVFQWIVGGFLLGMGCLGKYTMFIAIPCSFMVFFTRFPWRGWAWGYAIHLLSALLAFSPVLIFNYTHQWVSFRFQWENAMQGGGGFVFSRFFEFLGSQVMLAGALPFLLFIFVCLKRKDYEKDARLYTCFWFFVIPMVFFTFQSFRNRLEANWALVTYLAFWPLAQRIFEWTSFKALSLGVTFVSFLVPLGVTAAIFIHLIVPLKWFPVTRDRIYRLKEQYEMSKTVAEEMKKQSDKLPLFLHNYQGVSYFRFFGVPSEQIYPAHKSSEFTIDPKFICGLNRAWYFTNRERPSEEDSVLKCFKSQKVIKEYPFKVRNELLDNYYWVLLEK
jgi:4-amino-4-deoxy-L-arabinose transferase-like glycosyltransferase